MTNSSLFSKTLLFSILIITSLNNHLIGQQINFSDTVNISEVIITANRSSRYINDVPGRVAIIDSKTIEELPVQNVDELLRHLSNVYVNRSWHNVFYFGANKFDHDHRALRRDDKTGKPVTLSLNSLSSFGIPSCCSIKQTLTNPSVVDVCLPSFFAASVKNLRGLVVEIKCPSK